ncbi:transposase [Succinimonas sp.]|uniref:IS66 family transposase n=1 Tax=Succinimonas sp. TaxID=1936151 RepID=UPI00386D8AB2
MIYTAKFIKAVKYSHNQWEKFTRILEDGATPLDNSAAERAIRDFAVLRHSMPSGFGSVEGAKSLLCSHHFMKLQSPWN